MLTSPIQPQQGPHNIQAVNDSADVHIYGKPLKEVKADKPADMHPGEWADQLLVEASRFLAFGLPIKAQQAINKARVFLALADPDFPWKTRKEGDAE